MSAKRLWEMLITEATPMGQAQRELNGSQSVAAAPRKYTPSTARAQSDVDSAQSVAKREGAIDETAGEGLRLSGDRATIGALVDCLHEASTAIGDNPDLVDWADEAYKACAAAMQRPGATGQLSVTLPAFSETPELDSFNDDPGTGAEEEE